MVYTVPQFIERETKIAGPFTFKQLVFLGTTAGLGVFLYFVLPFFLFMIVAVLLAGAALALAFFKVSGHPLPAVIKNFFIFSARAKIYLWQKKVIPLKIVKREERPKEEVKKGSVLKMAERSGLKELSAFLETKTK